jgi:hypothetical protein
VRTFANAAARSTAIPTPTEGIVTWLNDVDRLDVYSNGGWSSPYGMTHIRTETVPASTTNASLNNIFTSEFRNYQIVMNVLADTTAFSMGLKFRLNGTDNSANYGYQVLITAGTGIQAGRSESITSARIAGISNLAWQSIILSVNNPAIAQPTTGFVQSQYYIPMEQELTAYRHLQSIAYDGITFVGGPFRGTISVYGMR